MTIGIIDESQRRAAKVVGCAYLFALVPAIFAEFYVRGQLIMSDNAAQTALNIVAHERLFRLGIASNLAVFAIDIALISSLYVVLKPINRSLALMATGWGMVETTILVVVTLSDFDVLRILSGAGYLQAFEVDRLHALARLSKPNFSRAACSCNSRSDSVKVSGLTRAACPSSVPGVGVRSGLFLVRMMIEDAHAWVPFCR